MSGTLLYSATETGSRRSVMIIDERTSVWAYLTGPGSTVPVSDCWLMNLIDAPESLDRFRAGSQVPPATRRYLADCDAARLPLTEELAVRWSADGDAVAVLFDSRPLGYLLAGTPHGFSKDLVRPGPFGQPFDHAQAARLFAI